MSILAYVGLPGSGKTYGVVANQIIPALKEKRVVVTNVPLHMERVLEAYPEADIRDFPTDSIAQQPELIDDYALPGCVLIIDELWKLFPAGQKVNHVPQPFKRLLAEHRHMVDEQGRSTQIVFVTQDLAQIGAFARQLVEQTFLHTKLGHLGTSGSFRVRIFHGQVTGQSPPKSSELNMTLGRYDAKIYSLYRSHTMSQAKGDGANEKAVDTRGNIWKRPGVLIAAVICVCVAFWSFSALGSIFKRKDAAGGASGATTAPPRSHAAAPSSRMKRTTWRVSGFIDVGTESLALLTSDVGEQVLMDGRGCQRSRFLSQCQYLGEWIPFSALPRLPAPAEPERPSLLPKLGD